MSSDDQSQRRGEDLRAVLRRQDPRRSINRPARGKVGKSAEMILKIFKERILGVKFSYLIVSLCLQRITADNLKFSVSLHF